MQSSPLKKPGWIRVSAPFGDSWKRVNLVLEKHRLRTVCDEAQCPNKGECWGAGTATFMLLGAVCTRSCRFCAVATGREGRPPESGEGEGIARAAEELGLSYVVLTSVDRDDLGDRGAGHFASCIRALKDRLPGVTVEVLIPDYTEAELPPILEAAPDVIGCNVETVRSLQWVRDRRASFDKTLVSLRAAKSGGAPVTKSSFILGLGEKEEEVLSAMDELRAAEVDILVMGQYLRPTAKQLPVAEYLDPERFDWYAGEACRRGFSAVVSSPFARTSYHAFDTARAAARGERP
ncbi:MAG: lipoyl synthase [Spirochaetaceae bacterium]|jgi:lipoic acid synthetase|nr:lipoyl synthase [Spirochaetaceae bacterium]